MHNYNKSSSSSMKLQNAVVEFRKKNLQETYQFVVKRL